MGESNGKKKGWIKINGERRRRNGKMGEIWKLEEAKVN